MGRLTVPARYASPAHQAGPGDMAKGGARQHLRRAQPRRHGRRLLRLAGLLVVPCPPQDIAEPEQDRAALLTIGMLEHRQQPQRPCVVPGRVLVRQQPAARSPARTENSTASCIASGADWVKWWASSARCGSRSSSNSACSTSATVRWRTSRRAAGASW